MLRLFVTVILYILLFFPPVFPQAGTIPAGLSSAFGFGAIDKADSWAGFSPHFYKDNQGTACWDYSYAYLTPGWATWVAGGAWASNEITYWEAKGQRQVFSFYYQPYNLGYYQDTTNMTNYFNDFKTLCQRISATSTKKVIIHIEPDLLGFWRQGSRTATQAGVVKVGGSNFDETCDGVNINGLPDTIRAWSEALYRIKNQYGGGKVLLAHHFTHWATGTDLFTSSHDQAACNTNVDDMTGYISGIENGLAYDLFFIDPADRDADWYRINGGGGNTRWTGPTRTYTNDRNWGKIAYITNRISNNLSRRGMFWQIPVGNTYYKTCNNSANHYRDNSAQEFLPSTSANGSSGTPGDAYSSSDTAKGPGYWAQNGIIGVLFGEGGYDGNVSPNNMTHLRDWPTDNTTNPGSDANAGGPAYDVWGQANSGDADNDGGYIRKAVARYCTTGKYVIGAPPVSPTNTQLIPTVTFTRTVTPSRTNTPVIPPTATFTRTVTNSPVDTSTFTFTRTPTLTRTASPAATETWTPSLTWTITSSRTSTMTRTPTQPVNTSTNTAQVTATNTPAATFTRTPGNTPVNTPVNTATNTAINTPVNTSTNTPINTPANTATNTPQPTWTYTVTRTQVVTTTNTPFGTLTASPVYTWTFTPQPSATVTRTNTQQPSPTRTQTAYLSPTVTPTLWNDSGGVFAFTSAPQVFPNPVASGSAFNISIGANRDADTVKVKIYSYSMRLVRSVEISGGMTVLSGRITVNADATKGLARGGYYYVVVGSAGNSGEIRSKTGLLVITRN